MNLIRQTTELINLPKDYNILYLVKGKDGAIFVSHVNHDVLFCDETSERMTSTFTHPRLLYGYPYEYIEEYYRIEL